MISNLENPEPRVWCGEAGADRSPVVSRRPASSSSPRLAFASRRARTRSRFRAGPLSRSVSVSWRRRMSPATAQCASERLGSPPSADAPRPHIERAATMSAAHHVVVHRRQAGSLISPTLREHDRPRPESPRPAPPPERSPMPAGAVRKHRAALSLALRLTPPVSVPAVARRSGDGSASRPRLTVEARCSCLQRSPNATACPNGAAGTG